MAGISRFEEEVRYWRESRLTPNGEGVLNEPRPWYQARQRATDWWRKARRELLVDGRRAPDSSEFGVESAPSGEDLRSESSDLPQPGMFLGSDEIAEFRELIGILLRSVGDDIVDRKIAYGFVRMLDLDQLLSPSQSEECESLLGDLIPITTAEVCEACGYSVRRKTSEGSGVASSAFYNRWNNVMATFQQTLRPAGDENKYGYGSQLNSRSFVPIVIDIETGNVVQVSSLEYDAESDAVRHANSLAIGWSFRSSRKYSVTTKEVPTS